MCENGAQTTAPPMAGKCPFSSVSETLIALGRIKLFQRLFSDLFTKQPTLFITFLSISQIITHKIDWHWNGQNRITFSTAFFQDFHDKISRFLDYRTRRTKLSPLANDIARALPYFSFRSITKTRKLISAVRHGTQRARLWATD